MDLSRFGSDGGYKLLLRDFLRAKYANKKIEVVVAVLGPAFFIPCWFTETRSFLEHPSFFAG